MAVPITIRSFALARSTTAGVLPPNLSKGEPFIQLADRFWLVGDGVSSPIDLPRIPFVSETDLLRPESPIGDAISTLVTDLALVRLEQAQGTNATLATVRGGVDPSLDTLAKLAGILALPVPAQRFSQADGNLVAGQTVFTVTGGYTPGIVAVYRNGLILSTADYVATNGSTVQITYAVTADEIVDIRPNRGGALLNAAPAVHTHAVDDLPGLTTAWLGALFTAWFGTLPVYSGDGPAPVPAGQPFNNAGRLEFAQ